MTYKMYIDDVCMAQSNDIILFVAQGEIALINTYNAWKPEAILSILEDFVYSCRMIEAGMLPQDTQVYYEIRVDN